MATSVELGKAFITDAAARPYFFSSRNTRNDLIIKEGTEMLISLGELFSSLILKQNQILDIYDFIWVKLDLIMELNDTYFKLYYDYLLEMLNYYLKVAEESDLFETCTNISALINFIGE
jgi:hypothetical protein